MEKALVLEGLVNDNVICIYPYKLLEYVNDLNIKKSEII